MFLHETGAEVKQRNQKVSSLCNKDREAENRKCEQSPTVSKKSEKTDEGTKHHPQMKVLVVEKQMTLLQTEELRYEEMNQKERWQTTEELDYFSDRLEQTSIHMNTVLHSSPDTG